ncbi:translin-associated factor X-interacting protein 1 isoform X2 [Onychostoma macrolepis]|uniref:translin-associated factor X-interacting protein 1 isoform X2 n=1 Tax=Onychostoma macrolepis TaxID=369639 RepID=UPI00272A1C92|nr:translin-associated factor X-interacting protein 1 isoform X2 [Onychostoma macrolepis]
MSLKELQLPPLLHSERGSQRHITNGISRSKFVKTNAGETSGNLSSWPAEVTNQIVQKPRGIKHHGYGKSLTKPRFLEQLESHLKRELEALDTHGIKVQELRLQVFQEVFGYLIEEFKTYKPIFSAIKNEYDITLAHLREQIRDLLPLRAKLVLVSEHCEKRILDQRVQERDELRALKRECQRLQRVIESMRGQQTALQIQVDHLKEDLATQYQLYRDERDARKLLITRISTMTSTQDTEHDDNNEGYNEEDESEDPVVVKMALQVCREDLTKVQVDLNRLQAEYSDVVPRRDWDNLNYVHEETLIKLETLQTDFDQLKSEYDTLLEVHCQSAPAVLHSNQSVVQHGSDNKHIVTTPRPNWEQCSDILGGSERCKELFEGQSSQKRLEILLQQMNGQNEFFTGLGTSSDVPIYLQYEGKLKNLKLKKADAVRVIKDIWREKNAENEKSDDTRDLQMFLHSYLVEHYKDKAGEWAYSLMESIQNNLEDDLICLLNDILIGKVDETIYHGQIQLLSHLLKVLIQSDTTQCGLLTVLEFSDALKKAFPLKADQDIEELLAIAQTELKSNGVRIAYQTLYTEDTDGRHKEFLSLVKKQATAERLQYISELRVQLEGKGEVDAEHLRTAFKTIDPSLDPETLDWNLSVAFQTKECELQAQALNTEVVLQRLSVANVKRAGPK